MRYYFSAILTSVSIVLAGMWMISANVQRCNLLTLFVYAIALFFGGWFPAVCCAWLLRVYAKRFGFNNVWQWLFCGMLLSVAYIGCAYSFAVNLGRHFNVNSIQGFIALTILGSAFLGAAWWGWLLAALIGAGNGAVLYLVNRNDR